MLNYFCGSRYISGEQQLSAKHNTCIFLLASHNLQSGQLQPPLYGDNTEI